MIAKMNFVSITGPKDDIDRIVDLYLSKYEIQLEYAPSELKSISTLYPYSEQNPYREQTRYAEELAEIIGKPGYTDERMELSDSAEVVNRIHEAVKICNAHTDELERKLKMYEEMLQKIVPFKNIDFNVDEILNFKNMRFRFGRIPKEYYMKFLDYVSDHLNSIFLKATEDEKYVWGIYFVALNEKVIVDAAYTSLHFERTFIPNDVHGTPEEAILEYTQKIEALKKQIEEAKETLKEEIDDNLEQL